jgi:hypothetical protein
VYGGGKKDLFLDCDINEEFCQGTRDKSRAARFRMIFVKKGPMFAYRLVGQKYCLSTRKNGKDELIAVEKCENPLDIRKVLS